jgi:alanyl-tRNA synthetase
VDVLADTMGDVFPEIRARKKQVQETIRTEEEAFNKTLDAGLHIFGEILWLQEQLESTHKIWRNAVKDKSSQITADLDLLKLFGEGLELMIQSGKRFNRELLEKAFPKHEVEALIAAKEIGEIFARKEKLFYGETGINLSNPSEQFTKFAKEQKELNERVTKWHECQKIIDAGVSAFSKRNNCISGESAFLLYDTYGFPLDLTELMARERGLTVDKDGFEKLMEEQRARARAAQKKEVISLSQIETTAPTKFTGFEKLESPARVLEVVSVKDKTAVVLDTSPFYAEMGGQVGDTGELTGSGQLWRVVNTQKSGNTFLHFISEDGERGSAGGSGTGVPPVSSNPQTTHGRDARATMQTGETPVLLLPGSTVTLAVEKSRRDAIQRHHTVTHLLHWALHQVASKEASQKGSFVGPEKLTFDFNSSPLTPQQISEIEKLVNEKILENAIVSWTEVAHADVKNRKDVMQFFGDKYGDTVRVVQIGGHAGKLDGYSMELCGGTHTRATGEIGLFRITGESAIAAGVRRIEAVAGLTAYGLANEQLQLIKSVAGKINSPVGELEKKVEALLAHQKELEKQIKSANHKEAASSAKNLLAKVENINSIPAIIVNLGAADGDTLQAIADALKSQFKGVIVLGGAANGAVALVASVSSDFTVKIQAGKIIQTIAPIVGGKGGGKPDNARGGGKDASKLDEALAKAKSLLGN